ncbi:CAZyme family GH18 [Penicillium roqueforti]|nr:CAZyme family GH18 [Penicillium roqueforti]
MLAEYAPTDSYDCPLNVCCSQYGFCGTTSDFCGTGCITGCDEVVEPSCSGSTSDARVIGYYSSSAYTRTCNAWTPEDIDAGLWTHLIYAFATIGSDYKIGMAKSFDSELYPRFTALKQSAAGLSTMISVGGWDEGGTIFSDMVSTTERRSTFIDSVMAFMSTYGFDGIDIDWEYPAASDRGGVAADTQNYVSLLKEMKAAFGSVYTVTATLPSSYWYLQGFDVSGMEPYVDWFHFMSYDIHGTWDGNNPYTEAVVQPHTNLTEIKEGLDLLWRNDIDPSKVVLGEAFYGRSFTLSESSCTSPGCPFSGGGTPGECTDTAGILSDAEIQNVISENNLTPILEETAAVKYIVWDDNQCSVSYWNRYSTLRCPVDKMSNRKLPAVWDKEHLKSWLLWVPPFAKSLGVDKCNRDEYPPFAFMESTGTTYTQWLRFLPESQNKGAGQLWKNICKDYKKETKLEGGPITSSTCTEIKSTVYTVNAMVMHFTNMPNDDLLADNPCLPEITHDYGFALMTNDRWYGVNYLQGHDSAAYAMDPEAALTQGLKPPRQKPAKRSLGYGIDEPISFDFNPEDIILDEGNSSRRVTPEELYELGLLKCESDNCVKEREALGIPYDEQDDAKIDMPLLATTSESASTTSGLPTDSRNSARVAYPVETGKSSSHLKHGRRHSN